MKRSQYFCGLCFVLIVMSACSSIKPKSPIQSRISSFVGIAVAFSSETTTPLLLGSSGYVQHKENRSTGYSWQYTISDTTKLALIAEDSFKKVFDQRKMGASSTKVWKFKAIGKGAVQIVFKYYRSWLGEKSAVATKIYKILIQ